MASTIRDYSATAASNTTVDGADISEGCSPAGINDAIRGVMADLKDVSTGAVSLESPAADSLSLSGALTTTSTIDGRDVAADGAKLDTIESSADVTDAGNVNPLVDAHLNQSTAASGEILSWNGSDYDWVAAGGGTPATETVGSVSGNATLDLTSGNVFNHTPTANTTFVLSNPPASGTAQGFTLALTGANVASGYDIANASYDNKSFSTNSQDSSSALVGLAFKSDGTKMYALTQNNFSVYQYSLSTAWDVSTASYDSVSFAVHPSYIGLADLRFKPDGTKFYVLDTGADVVRQYSLSTAWDLSTASIDNVTFSVQTQDSSPRVLDFKPDGTKMFYGGATSETVYEYDLSTAWDISTASYSNKSFSTATQDSQLYGMTFNSSGTKMFTGGGSNDSVFQYSLSTAWDISTASYDSVSFSVASQSGYANALNFKTDGTKLYLSGKFTNSVFQYSTSGAGGAATIAYPSSVEFAGGTAPDAPAAGETDILTFYTSDGGTTYQGFKAGDAMS